MKELPEGCRFKQNRLEMVAPFVSGTIWWCKKNREICYGKCGDYSPTTARRMINFIKEIYERQGHLAKSKR